MNVLSVRILFATLAVAVAVAVVVVDAQNDGTTFLDRFTYEDETIDRGDGFFDYRPPDWNDIKCDERTRDGLDQCVGYSYKWHEGIDWTIQKNYCRWCPEGSFGKCHGDIDDNGQEIRHHQSPIDLQREYGLEPGTHENARECVDLHWMKYEDSTCSLQELIDSDAFTIERHGLRISQPITAYEDLSEDIDGVPDGVRLNCRTPGIGSRFGRIDFSKGFADWWYLSHMDLHVPSEHTQQGKRYDAELQMYHFYSIPYDNEMAAVTVLLEAYDDAAPWAELDKVICQWRRKEYETRTQCGLVPINGTYPGCFPLTRRDRERNLRRETGEEEDLIKDENRDGSIPTKHQPFKNIADVIFYNDAHQDDASSTHKVKIDVDEINFSEAEDKDWEAWIAEQSKDMREKEEVYKKMKDIKYKGDHNDEDLHENYRRLIGENDDTWFNYFPMLAVRTEYYFRYQGSQTIPPCYGNVVRGSREGTNHWRVLKDPIRIHPRQLKELKRLVADRIAPKDDPVMPCQPDTAGKVTRDDSVLNEDGRGRVVDVDTARPKQYIYPEGHLITFCEW
mmetsp:Transcript_37127/g.90009  ORF Transcript_37127/g.90009 Transcript_37127/m.90009 type:complete len:562 (+) Transcript_37127:94-1779(+)